MPELPEVETIKNDLQKKIIRKAIKKVEIRKKKIIRGNAIAFAKILQGNHVKNISRRGKLLIMALKKGEKYLLVHLKMTGQLIYKKGSKIVGGGHGELDTKGGLPNKHTHIIFNFQDGSRLFFNDLRQFGYMEIIDVKGLEKVEAGYGPEPLSAEFTLEKFSDILSGKKKAVKAALMDQKNIAGIGNIYADEICFYAGVKPTRPVPTLTKAEIKKLHQGCRMILRKAVKYRGTTFSDYVDGKGKRGNFIKLLKVYGRERQKCLRCQPGTGAPRERKKSVIKKITAGGRGTRYCEKCQK